jgi:integrase
MPKRSKGEGSVYQTADGRYRGAVLIEDRATGEQTRRYLTGTSRADVARKMKALRDEGTVPSSLTVAEYLGTWLQGERPRVKASTFRHKEQNLRLHIIPAIGSRRLSALTPGDVERMLAGMAERGMAPNSMKVTRVILRRALADALRDGLVSRNAAALARPPRVPSKAMEPGTDYLPPADLGHLIASITEHDLGPLVTLAATTGLRKGELLALRWSDVDLEAGRLTVRRSLARAWTDAGMAWADQEPKTARSRRTVDLPGPALAALKRQRARQDADADSLGTAWQDTAGRVFTDRLGRAWTMPMLDHAWSDLRAEAGIRIPFHGLRHSAATAMLAGGVPLRTVADVLGHASIATTADIYGAVVPDSRREAASVMERMLAA